MSTASFGAMNEPFNIGADLYVYVLSTEQDGSENIQIFGAESLSHAQAVRALYEARFNKVVRTVALVDIPQGLMLLS